MTATNVYVSLPLLWLHGWGTVGRHVAMELSRLAPVRLVTSNLSPAVVRNDDDYEILRRIVDPEFSETTEKPVRLPGPLLCNISTCEMLPRRPNLSGRPTIGHSVFEQTRLPPGAVENARRYFDHIATGSRWCEQILREHGLANVSTVSAAILRQVSENAPKVKMSSNGNNATLRSGPVIR